MKGIPPMKFLDRSLFRSRVVSRRPILIAMCPWALVASLFLARPAMAQDQGVIDKIVQLNKKAMDDYDTADFDPAKKALLDAEKIGKRAGLESHPVMARTYIHLGALYLVGFKDKQKAQHYLGKALDIQADIRLDKTLTSNSVRDLFASVKAQRGSAAESDAESLFPPAKGAGKDAKPGTTGRAPAEESVATESTDAASADQRKRRSAGDVDVEPDLPASIAALDCPYPDDTAPNKKVTLRCAAAAKLGVAGVALFYKGFQMKDYEKIAMTKSAKGWWQVTVPKKRVDGKSLQFYFEGLDATDNPVVSNGRAESPNVMLIVDKGSQLAAGVPKEEDENPLEERSSSSPRLMLGKYDDSSVGVDTHFGNRRFWIGLGFGTGFVWAINGVAESTVKGTYVNGSVGAAGGAQFDMAPKFTIQGLGWAGLGQLVPEIGIQINPNWAVSVEGRHQWIPQAKLAANYTASGAHAGLLKVIRYSKQQRARFFVAAAGGGGEGVRMTIQTDPVKNPSLKDTVLIGGLLFGASGGFLYEISRKFSWVAEVNALFGTPKMGFVFDINTGFQANFGDTSGAAEAAAAKKQDSVSTSVDDEDPK